MPKESLNYIPHLNNYSTKLTILLVLSVQNRNFKTGVGLLLIRWRVLTLYLFNNFCNNLEMSDFGEQVSDAEYNCDLIYLQSIL